MPLYLTGRLIKMTASQKTCQLPILINELSGERPDTTEHLSAKVVFSFLLFSLSEGSFFTLKKQKE
jgi:hypothetical protein